MPSDRAAPTLIDVAREAGVSTATVSRCLNTPDRVIDTTRERVLSAIERLGYTPNFAARVMAVKRTHTIGAIIPTMENAIFARGLQALQEELAEAGVTLLVATSNYDSEREERQIRILLGRGVDGLVLIGEARGAAAYELIQRRGVPFVLVWTWRPDSPWPCVGFDNRAAARALAERVLDLGHRRIAMIAGITHDNDRAASRVEGVREALAARGVALDPRWLVEAEYQIDAGAVAARRLLSLDDRPTAIICGNDVLAAGAMLAARRMGLKVPGDVSITGFDNIDLARLLDPPLTTVHVPHRRMGHTAAKMLLTLRDPGARSESICFQTEIVKGASLAPPALPKST